MRRSPLALSWEKSGASLLKTVHTCRVLFVTAVLGHQCSMSSLFSLPKCPLHIMLVLLPCLAHLCCEGDLLQSRMQVSPIARPDGIETCHLETTS